MSELERIKKSEPKQVRSSCGELSRAAAAVSSALAAIAEKSRHHSANRVWNQTFRLLFDKTITLLRVRSQKLLTTHNPEGIKVEANSQQRPMIQLIQQAVITYEDSNEGRHVSYKASADKFGLSDFALFFNQVYQESDIESLKIADLFVYNKTRQKKISLAGKKVSQILTEALQAGFSYEEVRELIRIKLPTHVSSLMRKAEEDGRSDLMSQEDYGHQLDRYLQAARSIEKRVEAAGEPVSASLVLEYFLRETGGEMQKALKLTAGFLKFMAREAASTPDLADSYWLQDHIKDEYSLDLPYDQLSQKEFPGKQSSLGKVASKIKASLLGIRYEPKPVNYDFSLMNKLGLPYHAFHMAALLEDFSPEMIAFMTNIEYLLHGPGHGWSKYLSDLTIIRDLKTIEDYLSQFSTS